MSTLIDPKNITNYNRSDSELETFWLFCLFVAGKNSDTASLKLSQFLQDMTPWDSPFSYLRSIDIHNSLINIRFSHEFSLVFSSLFFIKKTVKKTATSRG